MKRLLIVLAVAAVLAIGSAAVAFAQESDQPGDYAGWCLGWGAGGAQGSNEPADNPALKQLADKMGISAEDLATELEVGKSVADVAKEKGVDLQTLVDALNAPMVEMMSIGVKYGYHTQEQANAMQKYMAERIRYQLEKKGFTGIYGWGPGMMGGGMMGPGMMGGGMMGLGGFRGTTGPNERGSSGMMDTGTGSFGGMVGTLVRGFGGMFGSGTRSFGGMMGGGPSSGWMGSGY